MIELPLIFLSGLLGSGHCVGMCGAFAMAIGWGSRRPLDNLIRQLCFSLGRAVTYTFLGVTAAFAGQQLQIKLGWLNGAQGVLSLLAGLLLVIAGLAATDWLPLRFTWMNRVTSCSAASQFRALLGSSSRLNVLIAGVMTGFLPCGLVYAFVALAAGTGSVLSGASVMATFALGTMPLMLVTGLGSSLLSATVRTRLLRLAACCVVVVGGITVARGASNLIAVSHSESPRCPQCHPNITSKASTADDQEQP